MRLYAKPCSLGARLSVLLSQIDRHIILYTIHQCQLRACDIAKRHKIIYNSAIVAMRFSRRIGCRLRIVQFIIITSSSTGHRTAAAVGGLRLMRLSCVQRTPFTFIHFSATTIFTTTTCYYHIELNCTVTTLHYTLLQYRSKEVREC
jgi:hypothetical protein